MGCWLWRIARRHSSPALSRLEQKIAATTAAAGRQAGARIQGIAGSDAATLTPSSYPLSTTPPEKNSTCPDVSFYSFGTIKTATALGGGLLIVHATDPPAQAPPPLHGHPLYARLAHLASHTLSAAAQQSTGDLLFRLARAGALHALSTPLACGVLASVLGPERYDREVTRWTRGFPAKDEAVRFLICGQRACRARPMPRLSSHASIYTPQQTGAPPPPPAPAPPRRASPPAAAARKGGEGPLVPAGTVRLC